MGNEIVGRLAKDAADEAENMSKEDRMITAADIRIAAKTSCLKNKWQRRQDLAPRL